jgi:hypothetical protein
VSDETSDGGLIVAPGTQRVAEGDRMQDEDAARPGEIMTVITKPATGSAAGTVR